MQSKCSQNAVKMQPKSQNSVKMLSKCSQNAVKMQSKWSQNEVKFHTLKCSKYTAKVQSKCSQSAVKMQPNSGKLQLKYSQNSVKMQPKFCQFLECLSTEKFLVLLLFWHVLTYFDLVYWLVLSWTLAHFIGHFYPLFVLRFWPTYFDVVWPKCIFWPSGFHSFLGPFS